MNTEQLRESVKQVVSKSLNEKLEEAVAQRLSIFEEKEEDCDKKSSKTAVGSGDDDEDGEGGDGGGAVSESADGESDDSDDDDDESEDDDEEDDELKETLGEDLKEALKVSAMPTSQRKLGTKGKAEELEVKDLRELTKMAKTGNYDYFTVTKKDGEEDEYHVSKGKLVLM